MPSWKIHNKWAKIFGIDEKVSNYVNEMIDFPEKFANKYPEYRNFLKNFINFNIKNNTISKIFDKHDISRKRKIMLSAQLEFLSRMGNEYVFAYFLHHVLDYLSRCVLLNDPLNRIYDKLYDPTYDLYLKTVLNFVKQYFEEIKKDILIEINKY